ncbi:hypothetical protein OUZ56_014606 [Daphnia magna]|uniref:Uncharacterized protein n=1 Tax=Daphnia magna TaxID=35525 RepID=A0ABR0AKN8_9CRUS|nr:hypothetical protein OUZ56_014606 [Daphnia magna]
MDVMLQKKLSCKQINLNVLFTPKLLFVESLSCESDVLCWPWDHSLIKKEYHQYCCYLIVLNMQAEYFKI